MKALAVLMALLLTAVRLAAAEPGDMRIAGSIVATIDRGRAPSVRAEGCAVFAADGRTCQRVMTPDALMRVASISKLVTAIGVMRMVEAGALDLDRDVSLTLGYWVRNPAYPKVPVTLRQLLVHTSSLTDAPGYVLGLGDRTANSIGEPGRWDGAHAPGSFFRYSNYNYVLIGTIMEAASGERFDRLMQRLVLDPLAVEGCFNWAACPDHLVRRAATLYRSGKDETGFTPGGPWVAQVDDLRGQRPVCPVFRNDPNGPCDLSAYRPGVNGGLFSPQGGLRITGAGLAKIAGMLLRDGQGPRGRFLTRVSVQALLTPGWRYDSPGAQGDMENGTMCAYGLSTHVLLGRKADSCRDSLFGDGRMRFGHLGEAYGLYGGIWIDPPAGRASVYLVTGTDRRPADQPGQRSGFTLLEERMADRAR